jgi:hypothetical protein
VANTHIFDTWTEESAYILGFWFADGSICNESNGKHRYKRWVIDNTDEQIALGIAEIMDCPINIQAKNRRKPCFRVRVRSDRLFDHCFSLVGSTKKSHTPLSFPDVPDAHLKHFVRGFFDGDGSIFLKSYVNRLDKPTSELQTSFSAASYTGNYLEELKQQIREQVPVKDKKIVRHRNMHKLTFCQKDSVYLCEWMYGGATIFMHRKHDVWERWRNTHEVTA